MKKAERGYALGDTVVRWQLGEDNQPLEFLNVDGAIFELEDYRFSYRQAIYHCIVPSWLLEYRRMAY